MGLFGVTLSGAPICGALNSTIIDNLPEVDDEQLCTRWYQLGMLLPFAHSMTKLDHRRRSPVDWSLNAQRTFNVYIQQRYRLLPYFYTLFYQVSFCCCRRRCRHRSSHSFDFSLSYLFFCFVLVV